MGRIWFCPLKQCGANFALHQHDVTTSGSVMKNKSTLIFSIALNGYQWLYHKELDSHHQYANKQGYDYQAVTRPYFSKLGVECCWLKLTLMQQAFNAGYEVVVFLDADAFVQASCPPIETVFKPHKYFFMAKGYTERFNSGVLIAKNESKVREWLNLLINHRNHQVTEQSNVGWGENGHIIEFSQNCSFIQELNNKWNNTFDSKLDDYIRHENFGPLRTNFLYNLIHKLISRTSRLLQKINRPICKTALQLELETQIIVKYYAIFQPVNQA
jgi:hypothetical protein